MTGVFFSPSTLGFYPAELMEDFKSSGSLPEDAVELSAKDSQNFWKVSPPEGKKLAASRGRPVWKDLPARTAEQVISLRQAAYRSESDPIYMEWQFDQTDEKKEAWRASVEAIKARYPLP